MLSSLSTSCHSLRQYHPQERAILFRAMNHALAQPRPGRATSPSTGHEPCVYDIPPTTFPPSTRQWRVEGGKREKRHIEIGLTPYPMLCSPSRAYVVHSRCILYQCMQFLRFYAITAHDTPKAVPTAARIADARFHRNFISLVLFSLVIFSTDFH